MKTKLIVSAFIIALCSSQAYAGEKMKMSKEDRKALMQECKTDAKEAKVAKEERKEWMKSCITEKFKAKSAE